MEVTAKNKQRFDAYGERLIDMRRKISDLLGVKISMETSINGDNLEAKFFGTPRSSEKQYEMTKITITPEDKYFANTEQNRVPGNEEYAKAFLSNSLKYRLSQKPIIGMFLFRKEKKRINKINKAIATSITGEEV
jgi:hypothetical protein